MKAAEPRTYRMVARAASTEATRERIVDAAVATFWERPGQRIALDDVAARAGVSVQTVIRHFGGRDGLMTAAAEHESARVASERDPGSVSTPTEAIVQLVAHYEALGDRVLAMLAEESREPGLAVVAEGGRRFHREWCARVFAGQLGAVPTAVRPRRLAQVVAVCDVYTWKLLRRDAGLDRRETETAMLEMLEPLLEGS